MRQPSRRSFKPDPAHSIAGTCSRRSTIRRRNAPPCALVPRVTEDARASLPNRHAGAGIRPRQQSLASTLELATEVARGLGGRLCLPMDNILRTWTFWIRTPLREECRAHLEQGKLKEMRAAPGNQRAAALFRDRGDGTTVVVVMSIWDSMASIRAFAGEDHDQPSIDAADRPKLFDREPWCAITRCPIGILSIACRPVVFRTSTSDARPEAASSPMLQRRPPAHRPIQACGRMFWFWLNRLPGSYLAFSLASRA